MGKNVVVVPEDDRLDKYVLQPVFAALMAYLGRPRTNVRVVDNPRARGISTVLTPDFVEALAARFPMAHVFVYCLDRDGLDARENQLRTVLDRLRGEIRENQAAEGILAVQEVEVWCLALDISALADPWETVRTDPDPKERYFTPLVEATSSTPGPGGGRQLLGSRVAKRYDLLRERCPELKDLEEALRPHLL